MPDLKMPDVNFTQIVGRVVRDAELKKLGGGSTLLKFTLVYSRKFKTKTGEPGEETLFIDCTLWGQSAEWLSEYAVKGAPLLVEGSLKQSNWEDGDGNKRSKIELSARRVQTLSWGEAVSDDNEYEEDDSSGDELPF